MKTDKDTTLQEIKDELQAFRDKRDWAQFHDPKNLAEAISIEAGELMEKFLWKDKDNIINKLKSDNEFKEEVGEELADIIIFCFQFANSTNLDLTQLIKDKIEKSDKKYPVEKAKGKADKYTKL